MIAVAREKIAARSAGNARAVEVDLTATAIPPERYDLVCTLLALHHIEDVRALLRVFHEMVAPGGWLCVSDLDQEDGSFHGAGFTGHSGFSRGAFAAWLEEAGFGDVRITTVGSVEKMTASGMRAFPLFLAVARRDASGAP
jgi:cyclopropane fatty-acyl-phospholipid synthase-like methyltransferase